MPKPALGRIVHVIVEPHTNNGADVAPAAITRVWEDGTVNLHVMLDGPHAAWFSSVPLVNDRPTPETEGHPYRVDNPTVAWWPPHV